MMRPYFILVFYVVYYYSEFLLREVLVRSAPTPFHI
jgi:hypothetical protein